METLIFILILLIMGYFSYSLISYFIIITTYLYLFTDMGAVFFIFYFAIFLIFLVKTIRIKLISKNIIKFINKNNLLPKISPTEQTALQGGTKWIEECFFNASIDFKKVKNEKIKRLSKEEQSFLDNEVNDLCEMTNDWEIFQERDLSKDVWKFLKEKRFLGMIIPKEYGGLGFSATMHSRVIEKLVTRSQVLAITVMVPNSLGPAELILKYGTDEQKDKYLEDLAYARQIPCFALTEANASSDATSISSEGIVFKNENDEIKIRLNFNKRYITLGNIATLLGLAFVLKDPDKILGNKENLGITFALVNTKLKGVDNSKRHDPMGIPFVNSPIIGKDVIISIKDIIGVKNGIGKGWDMLVESLSIGRGISLPSISVGACKYSLKVVASYSNLRDQFGLSINKFEGVEEKIAKIASFTYMLNAARNYTIDAIDNGEKPSVINAIMKYHATEKFREVINDSMDILGGCAIMKGEKNLLAHAYFAVPISITVEGANILTRNLMHFGQGLIKSHPYIYKEITALNNNDSESFDKAFFSHISLSYKAFIKSMVLYATRAYFTKQKGELKRYKQKLYWISCEFTLLSNLALIILGPSLKKRENISARFGDILSYSYLALASIREYENNHNKSDKLLLDYICNYCFAKVQIAREEIIENLGYISFLLPLVKINVFSTMPKDKINAKIVSSLNNESIINELSSNIFISKNKNDKFSMLIEANKLYKNNSNNFLILKNAIKNKIIKKSNFKNMLNELFELKLINKKQKDSMTKAYNLKQKAISVDSFTNREYKGLK